MLLWHREASEPLRRVWIAAVTALVVVLALIMGPFWTIAPSPWSDTQFPFRLNSYVAFAVAAIVLVAALALQRAAVYERRRAQSRPPASAADRGRRGQRGALPLAGGRSQHVVPGYFVNRHVAFVSSATSCRRACTPVSLLRHSAPIVRRARRADARDRSRRRCTAIALRASVDVPPGLAADPDQHRRRTLRRPARSACAGWVAIRRASPSWRD